MIQLFYDLFYEYLPTILMTIGSIISLVAILESIHYKRLNVVVIFLAVSIFLIGLKLSVSRIQPIAAPLQSKEISFKTQLIPLMVKDIG